MKFCCVSEVMTPDRPVFMHGFGARTSKSEGVHDQLYVQLTGQAAYPVYAAAKDHFFYTLFDARLEFERDAAGKVVALVLHQNGQDQRAPRQP